METKREPGYYFVTNRRGRQTVSQWVDDEGRPFWATPDSPLEPFDNGMQEINETRITPDLLSEISTLRAERDRLKTELVDTHKELQRVYKLVDTHFNLCTMAEGERDRLKEALEAVYVKITVIDESPL